MKELFSQSVLSEGPIYVSQ